MRKVICTTALLLMMSVSVTRCAQSPYVQAKHLNAVIRVNVLEDLNARLAGLLKKMNPYTNIKNPLYGIVGPFLRNTNLQDVLVRKQVEFLFFKKPGEASGEWAAVFPVRDAKDYRVILTGQAGIREESIDGDISHFRQQHKGGVSNFFTLFLSNNLVIVGDSREVIKSCRALYKQNAWRGMLFQKRGDVVISINLRRYLAIEKAAMQASFSLLSEDIGRDIVGPSIKRDHSFMLVADSFLKSLVRHMEQFEMLDISLSLGQKQIVVNTDISLSQQKSLQDIAAKAPQSKLHLIDFLPPESVSVKGMLMWNDLWKQVISEVGGVLSSGLTSTMSFDARSEIQKGIDSIEAADPLETASATIPASDDLKAYGPVMVKLVKWRSAASAVKMIDNIMGLFSSGSSFDEYLAQNSIRVEVTRRKLKEAVPGVQLDHISASISLKGSVFDGVGISSREQQFLFAQVGDISAIVSSRMLPNRPADNKRMEDNKRIAEMRLAVMTKLVERIRKHQLKEGTQEVSEFSKIRDSVTAMHRNFTPVSFGTVDVGRYISLSLAAVNLWNGGKDGVRKFKAQPAGYGASWSAGCSDKGVSIIFAIKNSALVSLTQSILNVSASSGK